MTALEQQKEELAQLIRHYNGKDWSPATSTNYSFKDGNGQIWVSRSGVDKALFSAEDFMTVDEIGKASGDYLNTKPSAETLIHSTIYGLFPETTVILHSHSVYPVLLSANSGDILRFQGYEIQKGIAGQTTHDATIEIPVFENTQDMEYFSNTLKNNQQKLKNHCFVIRKHGTYAWGKTTFEAKRHLETLEYLCQCEWMI